MTRDTDTATLSRCSWCGTDPMYVDYHDTEWGVPERDSQALFEKLILDGFQAGLSWIIILRKRANFRAAFDNFDPERMAVYDDEKLTALAADVGIVRNRAKIVAAVNSAQAYLRMQAAGQNFADYIWQFTEGKTLQPKRKTLHAIPTQSAESEAMARDLRHQGFKFCGPTICYAFMQAVGMVNDHTANCFRWKLLHTPK